MAFAARLVHWVHEFKQSIACICGFVEDIWNQWMDVKCDISRNDLSADTECRNCIVARHPNADKIKFTRGMCLPFFPLLLSPSASSSSSTHSFVRSFISAVCGCLAQWMNDCAYVFGVYFTIFYPLHVCVAECVRSHFQFSTCIFSVSTLAFFFDIKWFWNLPGENISRMKCFGTITRGCIFRIFRRLVYVPYSVGTTQINVRLRS